MRSKQDHQGRSNGNTPAKYNSDEAGPASAEKRAMVPRSPTKDGRRSKATMREAFKAAGLSIQEGKGCQNSSPSRPILVFNSLLRTTARLTVDTDTHRHGAGGKGFRTQRIYSLINSDGAGANLGNCRQCSAQLVNDVRSRHHSFPIPVCTVLQWLWIYVSALTPPPSCPAHTTPDFASIISRSTMPAAARSLGITARAAKSTAWDRGKLRREGLCSRLLRWTPQPRRPTPRSCKRVSGSYLTVQHRCLAGSRLTQPQQPRGPTTRSTAGVQVGPTTCRNPTN